MKDLNAFIVKFGLLSKEREDELEVLIYSSMLQNFTEKEQEDFMIQDEENRTLVVFIPESYKHKIDNFVNSIKRAEPEVIELYEDVTEKLLYKNDFTAYNVQEGLIVDFIKENLTKNNVLDKIIDLGGMGMLTKTDLEILEEAA